MADMAEQVLGLPIRRGWPTKVGGLVDVVRSPAYATGVGLVMFGANAGRSPAAHPGRGVEVQTGVIKRVWSRLAEMF
jgi:cell division protein FtsA